MTGSNDLVVKPDAEPGGFFNAGTGDNGWATGISIAESAMDTYNGIKDGNWIQAGLGMVGLAADAAAMAIDPFGTLLSSAAAFLMEHVQPLKDMLDKLAGDPPVIESYSTTWGKVSEELGKVAQEYAEAVKSGTQGWTGPAAEAYLANSKQHSDALSGAASAAGTVGTVVGMMGMVVGFVREVVRDLIADLVGKLIAWVLE
uniref:PPE domain-containing protein n=1 Tax=Saccharothrix syringae TaxID=103733 RepID=UPI0005242E6B